MKRIAILSRLFGLFSLLGLCACSGRDPTAPVESAALDSSGPTALRLLRPS